MQKHAACKNSSALRQANILSLNFTLTLHLQDKMTFVKIQQSGFLHDCTAFVYIIYTLQISIFEYYNASYHELPDVNLRIELSGNSG